MSSSDFIAEIIHIVWHLRCVQSERKSWMPNRTLSSECVYALASNKHNSILRAIAFCGSYHGACRVCFYPETWSKDVRSAHSSHRTGYFWVVCVPRPHAQLFTFGRCPNQCPPYACSSPGTWIKSRRRRAHQFLRCYCYWRDAHNILFTCAKEQRSLRSAAGLFFVRIIFLMMPPPPN